MASHVNNGACPKCVEIINKYPNFSLTLMWWFESFQRLNPTAHVSAAGRGKADQEEDFAKRASKAHYGESPHNYNAALDIFRLTQTGANWDKPWFTSVMAPSAKAHGLEWGGDWKGTLGDFPHVQLANYKDLVKQGKLKLVE